MVFVLKSARDFKNATARRAKWPRTGGMRREKPTASVKKPGVIKKGAAISKNMPSTMGCNGVRPA